VEKTWFGRNRITGTRDCGSREIIVNPKTGEILRDFWLNARGRVRAADIDPEEVDEDSAKSGIETSSDTRDGGEDARDSRQDARDDARDNRESSSEGSSGRGGETDSDGDRPDDWNRNRIASPTGGAIADAAQARPVGGVDLAGALHGVPCGGHIVVNLESPARPADMAAARIA
jgi:hypothetical protein